MKRVLTTLVAAMVCALVLSGCPQKRASAQKGGAPGCHASPMG